MSSTRTQNQLCTATLISSHSSVFTFHFGHGLRKSPHWFKQRQYTEGGQYEHKWCCKNNLPFLYNHIILHCTDHWKPRNIFLAATHTQYTLFTVHYTLQIYNMADWRSGLIPEGFWFKSQMHLANVWDPTLLQGSFRLFTNKTKTSN